MADLAEDPQLKASNWLQSHKDDVRGEYQSLKTPFLVHSDSAIREDLPAPQLSEQGAAILAQLGYTPEQIDTLVKAKVVYCSLMLGFYLFVRNWPAKASICPHVRGHCVFLAQGLSA